MDNTELYHHGIKGMRWGVRRYQKKDGSLTLLGRRHARKESTMSDDAKTVTSLKKKHVSQMSNSELRKLNERQQLERTYRQMNKSHVAKGLAVVAAAAGTTNTLINLYNNSSKLANIGKSAMDKAIKYHGNTLIKDLL